MACWSRRKEPVGLDAFVVGQAVGLVLPGLLILPYLPSLPYLGGQVGR